MSLPSKQVFSLLFDETSQSGGQPSASTISPALYSISGMAGGKAASLFALGGTHGAAAQDLILLAGHLRKATAKGHAIVLAHDGELRLHDSPELLLAQSGLFQALSEAAAGQTLVCIVNGSLEGFMAMLPTLADASFLVHGQGQLALEAASVVEAVCGIRQDAERLGGALAHARTSGLASRACPHLLDAVLQTRRHVLAMRNTVPTQVSFTKAQLQLDQLLPPDDSDDTYDIRVLLDAIADPGSFLEVQPELKTALITGFARLDGQACAVIASTPAHMAACLDLAALQKAGRFLALCNRRKLPVISLIDTLGFIPGESQEHGGIALAAAALLQQWQTHSAAVIALVLRHAYGAAPLALGLSAGLSRGTGLAWDKAVISAGGRNGSAIDAGLSRIQPSQSAIALSSLLRQETLGEAEALSRETLNVH